MKKGLALLLAASMSLSAFSTAFAADLTAEEKFKELVEKKIFQGFEDGSSRLDENMTRAQFATVIANLMGLEEVKPATPTFKDVKADHWVYGDLEAAVKAGLINGMGDGTFAPSANVTLEQMAKLLVEALDLEVDANATVEGTVSPTMAGYVAAAIKAGLIEASSNYKSAAKRELLVNATYVAEDEINSDVSATAVVNKDNTVTISGEATEATEVTVKVGTAFEQKVAVTAGKYTVTTGVLASGKHTATVTAGDESASAEFEIAAAQYAVKAVGAKKIEVTFGTAVDTAKAVITVKKGSIPVNIKEVKYNDAKTVATVELATSLTKGEYTVSAAGVAAEALTAKITAEDEKVSKIEFASDKAPINETDNKKISVGIKVSNQYGEDITNSTGLTLTSGRGTAAKSNGTITITDTNDFVLDQKIALSAVHSSTGTFATTVLTVSPVAKAATLEIAKLYQPDDESLVAGSTDPFYLVVKAKDQYGNAISGDNLENDVIVTVAATNVADIKRVGGANSDADFATMSIDGTTETVLPLQGPFTAGTSTVFMISKTTGNRATFDVVVAETSKVDTLTLSAPEIAVGKEKVKIPFEAIDQFGKAMTKDTVIEAGLTSAVSTSLGAIDFKQDFVANKAYLELDLTGVDVADGTTQTAFITAVTKTGKIAQLSVTVQPNAKAAVISGTKDFTSNFAVGATGSLAIGNVKVLDQYNRDYTVSDKLGTGTDEYRVAVKTSDATKVELSGQQFTLATTPTATTLYGFDGEGTDEAVTFDAKAKGSSTITLELYKGASTTPVASSSYTFNSKVVEKADITSYEVEDVGTLLATTDTDYHKDVKVNGVISGDQKVALPSSYYTVTSAVYDSTSGKLNGNLVVADLDGDTSEVTKSLIVTVNAANVAPIVKEVKVSDKASAVATLSLKDSATLGNAKKEGDGWISVDRANIDTQAELVAVANAIVKAVDQYGVEVSPEFNVAGASVIATAFSNSSHASLATVAQGESFNVTAITDNSKIITFKVQVK